MYITIMILQNTVMALKILYPLPIHLSLLSALDNQDLFTVSIILPFLERHIVKVIKFEMLLGTLDATPKVPQYTGLNPRDP